MEPLRRGYGYTIYTPFDELRFHAKTAKGTSPRQGIFATLTKLTAKNARSAKFKEFSLRSLRAWHSKKFVFH